MKCAQGNKSFLSDLVNHFCEFVAVFLEKSKKDLSDNKQSAKFAATRPALLRSLFIAGLLCKHFDFDRHMEEEKKVKFRTLVFLIFSALLVLPSHLVKIYRQFFCCVTFWIFRNIWQANSDHSFFRSSFKFCLHCTARHINGILTHCCYKFLMFDLI